MIDLADVLGQNGAHVNITGIPGAATKSSGLLDIMCAVQHHAPQSAGRYTEPLHIVPVVLSVKATDLLFLDRAQSNLSTPAGSGDGGLARDRHPRARPVRRRHASTCPSSSGTEVAEQRGREAQPYSWGLEDLIERNLFPYIFAEDDREDDNFAGLLSMIERMLARERIEEGRVVLRMLDAPRAPRTLRAADRLGRRPARRRPAQPARTAPRHGEQALPPPAAHRAVRLGRAAGRGAARPSAGHHRHRDGRRRAWSTSPLSATPACSGSWSAPSCARSRTRGLDRAPCAACATCSCSTS